MRGDTFFRVRDTDLDWQTWLAEAPERYAAAVAAASGKSGAGVEIEDGGVESAGLVAGEVGGRKRRRRLMGKTPSDAVAARDLEVEEREREERERGERIAKSRRRPV